MKNKKILCYIGYIISILLVIIMFFTNLPSNIDLVLGILFGSVFAFSHTQFLHPKMLHEDKEYKINILDERNILIKEKAGNIANMLMLFLLGITTVLFIALNYIIPAIIIGVLIFIQPVLLIFISKYLEKQL